MTGDFVRVERGTLSDEEIAALAAVLLARTSLQKQRGAPSRHPSSGATAPPWGAGRLHPGYRSPASWQR